MSELNAEIEYDREDILVTDAERLRYKLIKIQNGDEYLGDCYTYLLLTVNLELRVYGVVVTTDSEVTYAAVIEELKDAFEVSSLIAYWCDFTHLSIEEDRWGEWNYQIHSPTVTGRGVMSTTSDGVAAFFMFDLIYARFYADSGTWINAENVLCGFTLVLLNNPQTRDTTLRFLTTFSKELREHTVKCYPNLVRIIDEVTSNDNT